jgi:hypothetical protein
MADVPVPGFRKYWPQQSSLKSEYHNITDTYPEAAPALQREYKVLGDIENLAGCTPAKVGKISEWTSILYSVEENRAKFCKVLDGKPLFSTLYCKYMVTLKELKVSALAGQWCSEQNLSGINVPGRRLPRSKETQEIYL